LNWLIKRAILLGHIYLFLFSFFMDSTEVHAQVFFESALGEWIGDGTLLNSSTEYSMNWERTLQNKFIKLEFKNKRNTKMGAVEFFATAYYKILTDSSFSGTWFDSRGISFPIYGFYSQTELKVNWGSEETEFGSTEYKLEGEIIWVTDFIKKDDELVQFGKAKYLVKSNN